jgi:PAS domain S-box
MYNEKELLNMESLKNELELALEENKRLKEEKSLLYAKFWNYKAVFNDILDVVMITDGKEGKIIDINMASFPQLGYSPEELIGEHFSSILVDREHDANLLEETQIFGTVLAEKKIRKKDGTICFMDMTLNTVEYEKAKVVLTTFRDVSERVKTEKKLKLFTDQLAELNASKDKFFSIIAHDLKSPFFGLLGLSQILCSELKSIDREDLRKYAENVNDSAKFIYQLLQNLLEWSRINTGKMEYQPEKFQMCNKIENIVKLLNFNAAEKKIALQYICPQYLTVYADVNMLNSILQNLISNAIKFTREGGLVEVTAFEDKDKTIIKVKDNGVGIPQQKLEKLFRIESTGSTLGTSKERGTGLGLILCKELVGKNNGSISVESIINEGTTFTVVLPAV